jgi:hypothetical protein
MAGKKQGKKKRAPRPELTERRFLPEQTYSSRMTAALGMAGSLLLGVGVYGEWIRHPTLDHAPWYVALGALGLIGSLWASSAALFALRVGDVGVAIERKGEVQRLRWADLEKLCLEGKNLVLSSSKANIRIPIGAHPRATSRIVSEADRRVPNIVSLDAAERGLLPKARESDGVLVRLEGLQIAGFQCAESGTLITFERDARLCPNCGEVYHRDHVPKKCVRCDAELERAALVV